LSNEINIQVEGTTFAYPDGTLALKGVDLAIRKGEFLAFIGQNGSGKTTLAKNIAGLLKPSSGRVLVEGQDTRKLPTSKLATKVGYIFQNPDHQLFNETVYKEIAYGPSNIGLSSEQIQDRVNEAMRIVGLDETYTGEHPFFLPKGLRQRVSIASILALRPSVIIVDEPTTGQDFKQSREIMDFLKELNGLGHTIIIITHDMPIVARYAERTVCTMDGRILLDGSTRDVFKAVDLLSSTYVRPPETRMLAYNLNDLGMPQDILLPEEMIETIKHTLADRS
jgi:energy-coupling factor transport system ATP-binding protein